MGSVTIAATYGAGGSVVAPLVAGKLGLHLIDRAIPLELASKLAEPLREALAEDERDHGGAVRRLITHAIDLSGLLVNVPMPFHRLGGDDQVAVSEEALRRAADADGVVLLGRAGVFALRHRADTLHVRLDGRPEARRRQAMRHEGLTEREATRFQRDADRARSAYVHQFYPRERWEDPRNYHLMLDSTVLSLDACADLIAAAARDLFARIGSPPEAAATPEGPSTTVTA